MTPEWATSLDRPAEHRGFSPAVGGAHWLPAADVVHTLGHLLRRVAKGVAFAGAASPDLTGSAGSPRCYTVSQ